MVSIQNIAAFPLMSAESPCAVTFHLARCAHGCVYVCVCKRKTVGTCICRCVCVC